MRKFLLILITTLVFAGCSEDFLQRESLNDLAENTFWNNESDALSALKFIDKDLISSLYTSFLIDNLMFLIDK